MLKQKDEVNEELSRARDIIKKKLTMIMKLRSLGRVREMRDESTSNKLSEQAEIAKEAEKDLFKLKHDAVHKQKRHKDEMQHLRLRYDGVGAWIRV